MKHVIEKSAVGCCCPESSPCSEVAAMTRRRRWAPPVVSFPVTDAEMEVDVEEEITFEAVVENDEEAGCIWYVNGVAAASTPTMTYASPRWDFIPCAAKCTTTEAVLRKSIR